jgi:hypothetical protein
VTEINGLGNYSHVQPGEVLCLPAGERDNLKILNLHGADGNPITIRNEGGKVLIIGETFLMGGIGFDNSSNIRITGTGVTSQCGVPYTAEEQDCGIEVGYAYRGIKLESETGMFRNIELDHLYVHHTSSITNTQGITFHPVPYQLISGISVHHNHVSNTSAEGIYVGSEPQGEPYETLGKVEYVNVSYNLVENTGYDGIKIKVAIHNVQVHHNVILNSGIKRKLNHQGGIKIAMSVGDYFNNLIIKGCEGIRYGRLLETSSTRYFNNIVVDAECGAMEAREENAQIFNNTIVRAATFGIHTFDPSATVLNNIVVDTLGTPIDAAGTLVFGNFTGSAAEAGFVDLLANDFHLLPNSPAVDVVSLSAIYPVDDYDGTLRPQGKAADLGALEYIPSSTPPTDPTTYHRTFLPIMSVQLKVK